MREFRNFLRAFAARWFVSMSGGLSVPLAIAALFVAPPAARLGMGITAIVGFVFAAYLIWANEHNRVRTLEDRIRELTEAVDFEICLGSVNLVQLTEIQGATYLVIGATIESKRGLSIAKNWSLDIQLETMDRPLRATFMPISSDYRWKHPPTGQDYVIPVADYLPNKTENSPLVGLARGLIIFVLAKCELLDLARDSTRLILSATDKNGKVHSTSSSMGEIKQSFPFSYRSDSGYQLTY